MAMVTAAEVWSGSEEKTITIPADVHSIELQATGANIHLRHYTDADDSEAAYFTLIANQSRAFNMKTIAGKVLYAYSTVGARLEMLYFTGLGC